MLPSSSSVRTRSCINSRQAIYIKPSNVTNTYVAFCLFLNLRTTDHSLQYGQPHEHKGPQDFSDKGGGGDDEDEDDDNAPPSPAQEQSPPHHGVVHPLHNQPGLHHMRTHSTPAASQSPPMGNGQYQPNRLSTPQPPNISRPGSRTHIRRTSSNLVPQNHPHPQAAQQQMMQQPGQHQHVSYGYPQQQHAPFYPQSQHQPTQQQTPPQPHHQTPPQHHPQHTPPMSQHAHFNTHPPPTSNMPQLYVSDHQHRTSLPPHMQAHQAHDNAQMAQMHASPPPSRPFQSPPLPGHPSLPPPPQASHSSGPSQPWHHHPVPAATMPALRTERHMDEQQQQQQPPRPSSIDVGAAMRYNVQDQPNSGRFGAPPAPPPSAPLRPPLRTTSTGGALSQPGRVNSTASDSKPKLRLNIPGEEPDSGTGESPSPKDTNKTNSTTPGRLAASDSSSHTNSLVLPAPSPRSASAGAILSAGATGPSNPFARPNIPKKEASNSEWRDGIASPISALPSRVMAESGYMNSPSSMFPELGFGSLHGNTLASPAVYQPTPITYNGPSFRDDAESKKDEKRQRSVDDADNAPSKKAKS